jgi:hypothetical protein
MAHLHQLFLIHNLEMPQATAKSACYTDHNKTLTAQWQCDIKSPDHFMNCLALQWEYY